MFLKGEGWNMIIFLFEITIRDILDYSNWVSYEGKIQKGRVFYKNMH